MRMHATSIGGRQQTRTRLRRKQGTKSGEGKKIKRKVADFQNGEYQRSHTSSSKERKADEKQRGMTEKYQK